MPVDTPRSGDRAGVRRRRSSQYDEDDGVELEQRAGFGSIGQETKTYSLGDAKTTTSSPASSSVSPSGSTSLPDNAPRVVSFSTNFQEEALDELARQHQTERDMRSSFTDPPTTAGREIPSTSTEFGAGEVKHVAGSEGSSASLPHSSSLAPRASAFTTSPPTGRNRGLSLRRAAIFNKQMPARRGTDAADIELQESGSSRGQAGLETETRRSASSPKKSSTARVTVSEIPHDMESLSSAGLQKASKGLPALPNYESWAEKQMRKSSRMVKLKNVLNEFRKIIFRTQDLPPSEEGRKITLDSSRRKKLIDERTGKEFVNNFIRSSRYTLWNFLPRQLFAQFSKVANFYFLCVSVLQAIPGLSTTGSYTTIIPLIFFVSISMAKEGYEDYRRHKLDKAENNSEASVLHTYRPTDKTSSSPWGASTSEPIGSLHWATIKWHQIRVGDIVKLKRDEAVPADLVLLHSNGFNGMAYVETMALDGETNLKGKQTTASLSRVCSTDDGMAGCNAHFVVEDPNVDLYKFEGRVIVDEDVSALTNNEVIYRGSVIRNTPEAIGVAIYTGEECKIRMNANSHPRIKAPHLQSVVNKIVIVIVMFVLALAIFNTVAYQIWQRKIERNSWYLTRGKVAFFPLLTSFFIMFNTMIPLSLYVAMEIIKLAQIILLNDIDMYDEETNTPFEARTSTINEELGQISYIFSDKTGTLTDNEMKFRKMSVAGTAWLHDVDLNGDNKTLLLHKKRGKGKGKGKRAARKSSIMERASIRLSGIGNVGLDGLADKSEAVESAVEEEPEGHSSARRAKTQPELRTYDMIRYIQHKPYTSFARKTRMFILSIALCHTCIPEVQEDGTTDFQSSSPDELALIRAAQELGYLVVNRDLGYLTLKCSPSAGTAADDIMETYEILDVIEFSSKRKRMSVLVRFPNKRICVITKGADSIIMQRLKLASLAARKVVEIEQRASRRKSMETQQALVRKSSVQIDRRTSIGIGRTSLTLGRASSQIVRKNNSQRLKPVRNELDQWLSERERDVDLSLVEENGQFYSRSPRASAQVTRHSAAYSDGRSSMAFEEEEDLVDESLVNDDAAVIERCFQHINDFATEGLRTLLYAYRFITEEEYATFKKGYLEATTSLIDRERKIEQSGEVIESDLELAGATAIEDKLQLGVPQAIEKLRRANIKMWMLTGDKRETAINIGHSCRLIKDYSTVVVLDQEAGEVEKSIASTIISINEGTVAHCVVVIDGQTLATIDENMALETLFLDLAILVDSVICCRASPSQKARLVKRIRHRVKNSVTLAIGDGANDIAMIQEAHVGIGITGKEGLQAARTSDYSIAQFRFLTKLLLVHGRWNYLRTCKYVVGTFWKEMLFYLTQALYQRYNGYTGTSLYESWSLSMFNTLFTSLPVIFMGIFEKDLAASTLLAVPELYTKGQRDEGFNVWIYMGWMFMASCEAMVVFFCMWGLFGMSDFVSGGDQSLFAIGEITFTASIVLISVKMQVLEMHNKSILALTSFVLSVGGWFLWNIILSTIYHKNTVYAVKHGFLDRFGRNALWWLTLILIISSVIVFELAVTGLRAAWWPTDADIFQELEKDLSCRRRFEEASALELQSGWLLDDKRTGSSESERKTERERLEQERREGAVEELLMNRPVGLTDDNNTSQKQQTHITSGILDPEISTVKLTERFKRRLGNSSH